MNRPLKVSLLGCGMIAETHLMAMRNAGMEILGVFSTDTSSARRFAQIHGLRAYDSMEELLADETELCAICTPSGTHASLAAAVMENGKHAVVEKPIALTSEDCQLIAETERKTGRFCAPISQLRFSKAYRNTKAALDRGDFGRMLLGLLSMKYYRSPEYYAGSWHGTKAMDGGGALMNQGIHGIDMLCGLLGYPTRISGHVATLHHSIEVEDTAAASLVFPDGALGIIDGSTAVACAKPRRLELCGTQASVTILEDELAEAEGVQISGGNSSGYKSYANPADITPDLHTAQYINIRNAILGTEVLYYTSADAIRTTEVIRCIYRSSETGQTIQFS